MNIKYSSQNDAKTLKNCAEQQDIFSDVPETKLNFLSAKRVIPMTVMVRTVDKTWVASSCLAFIGKALMSEQAMLFRNRLSSISDSMQIGPDSNPQRRFRKRYL